MTKKTVLLGSAGAAALLFAWGAAADERPDDEIVVTATPLERTGAEIAVPVTTIDRDEILRSGARSLGELLGDEPGINQSAFAVGASRPIVRGLDNFRVRVQENGLGAHDVSALSEDHGVPIDPLAARRVEVVRGPAVLRYGSEAIGGVVNVLNDRIASQRPEDGFAAEAGGSFGSVDKGIDGFAVATGAIGRLVLHADGFARATSDYDIPRSPGEQARTESQSHGAAGGASILFDKGYAGVSVAYFQSDYDIPAAEEPLFIDMEQTKVQFRTAWEALDGFISGVSLDAGYSDYTHDEVNEEDKVIGSTFENDEWEVRGEAIHAPIGAFEGAFGFQVRGRELEGAGEAGELIAPVDQTAIAGFLFEEMALTDNTTLQFGARVEHVEADGTAFEAAGFDGASATTEFETTRDFTPISGSIGIVHTLTPEIVLGASAQYVQRAPDPLELYSKGPHEATETFEIGDPDLDKETARSFEISLRDESGPLRFEGAVFYTSFKDFIFKNFTGLQCDDDFASCGSGGGDELDQVAFTQDDAEFVGGEFQVAWDAAEFANGIMTLGARFDVVDAELDTGGNVPRIPPMRYGGSIAFERSDLFAKVSLLRAAEQDETAAFENATKGYIDLSAELVLRIDAPAAEANALEFGVKGTNLLDDDIRIHSSFKNDDVLQPGAGVRVFARASF